MSFFLSPERVAPLTTLIYRAWFSTLRFRQEGIERLIEFHAAKKPSIAALWHNELFALVGYGAFKTYMQFTGIVSQSKDGEYLALPMERLGIKTARGSSRRGGMQALVSARRIMRRENRICVITVDGPTGPRHEVKEGALYLAQKTGAHIFPVRVISPRAYEFNSWDRFRLPMPFSTCTIIAGEPYTVTDEKLQGDVMAREKAGLKERLDALWTPGTGR